MRWRVRGKCNICFGHTYFTSTSNQLAYFSSSETTSVKIRKSYINQQGLSTRECINYNNIY